MRWHPVPAHEGCKAFHLSTLSTDDRERLRGSVLSGLRRAVTGHTGLDGVGQFWDVVAGFHHALIGDKLAGRGDCVFLDGHVAAHPRSETFPLAWPH